MNIINSSKCSIIKIIVFVIHFSIYSTIIFTAPLKTIETPSPSKATPTCKTPRIPALFLPVCNELDEFQVN